MYRNCIKQYVTYVWCVSCFVVYWYCFLFFIIFIFVNNFLSSEYCTLYHDRKKRVVEFYKHTSNVLLIMFCFYQIKLMSSRKACIRNRFLLTFKLFQFLWWWCHKLKDWQFSQISGNSSIIRLKAMTSYVL